MNTIRIYTRSQIQPVLEKYIYQAYESYQGDYPLSRQ
ncbi:Uncharacterised protein [Streptococcus pyogenes]|nr:Uncharacterised protein [Streptococcus pyogenes]VGU06868.1 Uncharacterised protein [Streptococcus pyogenes]